MQKGGCQLRVQFFTGAEELGRGQGASLDLLQLPQSQFQRHRGVLLPSQPSPGRGGKLPLMAVAVPDNSLGPSGNGHTRAGLDVLGTVEDGAMAQVSTRGAPAPR